MNSRIDVERAILGAIILHRDGYARVSDILSEKNFSNNVEGHYNHSEIFSSIEALYPHTPIDIVTINHRMGGKYAHYLAILTSNVYSAQNIQAHALILLEINFRESAISVLTTRKNSIHVSPVVHAAINEVIECFYDYHNYDTFNLVSTSIQYFDSMGEESVAISLLEINKKIIARIHQIREQTRTKSLIENLKHLGSEPSDFKTRLAIDKIIDLFLTACSTGKIGSSEQCDKILDL